MYQQTFTRLMMKRSTILLLLGCTFLTFGYTRDQTGALVSKIYLHNTTLIRTTPGVDIWFYDLSTPANVREVGSIRIDGNSDVATYNTTMYADQEHDLVVYDISNPAQARPVDTIPDIFYRSGTEIANWLNGNSWDGGNELGGASGCGADGCDVNNGSSDSDFDNSWDDTWGGGSMSDYQPLSYSSNGSMGVTNAATSTSTSGSSSNSTTSGVGGNRREGTGGSLARFIIVGKRLYCIDNKDLIVFDLTNPSEPKLLKRTEVSQDIETIFYAKYHLFIGGQQGVYIYDVEDNIDPQYRGEFQHVERCDPVVVDGDRAYVTLRGDSPCGGTTSQMDILDVSDVEHPRLLKSYEKLNSPFGLAVRNGIAIVCDGQSGLRVLNVENENRVKECGKVTDITPFDVIWQDNMLIVTAKEGFFLYDASDPCNLKKYSQLF